jgi:hypothetical protein
MENQLRQQGKNKCSEGRGRSNQNQKEALSKKALEEYSALRTLIEKREIKELEEPDRSENNFQDDFNRAAYLKEMKVISPRTTQIKPWTSSMA